MSSPSSFSRSVPITGAKLIRILSIISSNCVAPESVNSITNAGIACESSVFSDICASVDVEFSSASSVLSV